jgi:hypothetical protein
VHACLCSAVDEQDELERRVSNILASSFVCKLCAGGGPVEIRLRTGNESTQSSSVLIRES